MFNNDLVPRLLLLIGRCEAIPHINIKSYLSSVHTLVMGDAHSRLVFVFNFNLCSMMTLKKP